LTVRIDNFVTVYCGFERFEWTTASEERLVALKWVQ
jgi:hypothetical protein